MIKVNGSDSFIRASLMLLLYRFSVHSKNTTSIRFDLSWTGFFIFKITQFRGWMLRFMARTVMLAVQLEHVYAIIVVSLVGLMSAFSLVSLVGSTYFLWLRQYYISLIIFRWYRGSGYAAESWSVFSLPILLVLTFEVVSNIIGGQYGLFSSKFYMSDRILQNEHIVSVKSSNFLSLKDAGWAGILDAIYVFRKRCLVQKFAIMPQNQVKTFGSKTNHINCIWNASKTRIRISQT